MRIPPHPLVTPTSLQRRGLDVLCQVEVLSMCPSRCRNLRILAAALQAVVFHTQAVRGTNQRSNLQFHCRARGSMGVRLLLYSFHPCA